MKEMEYNPQAYGLTYEDIFFKATDGITLHGWLVPSTNSRGTVLFCHGNAGNLSHRLDKVKFFHDKGYDVFVFDYRGYGKSKGSPFEEGLYRDVEGAYGVLISRGVPAEKIIGYGESLGGAVIIDLACRFPLGALIVDSTFNSARDMATRIYPFLPPWIFASRFDSENKMRACTIPKLFIHSSNDEVVPFLLGKKLFDGAAGPKEFLEIRGAHNSNFFESEGLLKEKVTEFMRTI